MSYNVYLGNLTIYQVGNVDDDGKRDLTVYDGLEQGKFPVAKNRDLHTWTVTCELTERKVNAPGWEPARDVFKVLDKYLASKDPERLVITGDYGKVSKLVLLKSYSKTEKYAGVYNVKLQLTEYVEAGVRTEDVPYIPRPGKVPEMPVKKVFKSQQEIAIDAMTRAGGGDPSMADFKKTVEYTYQYTDDQGNVKYTNNPLCVPINKEVRITAPSSNNHPLPTNALEAGIYGARDAFTNNITKPFIGWVLKSFDAIKNAKSQAEENYKKENQQRIDSLKK